MTDAVHEVEVTFSAPDERRAVAITDAVREEVGEIDDERSWTVVDRTGSEVHLTVQATDLTALRAAVTTWTGLVRVAERVTAAASASSPR